MAENPRSPSPPVRRGARPGPRRQPPPVLDPGTRVAGYEVVRRLGAGGYGTVYLAHATTSLVALKVLPLERSRGWEEREVDVLRRMRHPGVVRLLGYVDWPEDEPRVRVLIMEYVDGLPLDEHVRGSNPSALGVVELMGEFMEALEAVHGAGVLHRDVKASNILVRAADGRPVLVDFGAGAYLGAPTLTSSVLPPGTPEYRSPEAWDFFRHHMGDAGVRYLPTRADDLWAAGVQLYWVLTDRLPFTGPDFLAIGAAVLNERPVPPRELNPWVPEALERLCLRMLEKSPDARYADAGEVRAVLAVLRAEAEESWREPLFEPHAPHNATTRPQGRLAQGQDLLLRMSRLARQPPRRGEVPTRKTSAGPGTAAPPREERDGTSTRAVLTAQAPVHGTRAGGGWRWGALGLGVLALTAALWLLHPWKTEVPSEVVGATQPFMSPEAFPIRWDAFFPDVVPSLKPPHVVADAAPNGQAVAAPVVNTRHSEKDMTEKQSSQKPPPPTQARKARPSISACLGLGALAALAAGCASVHNKAFYENFVKSKILYEAEGLMDCPPSSIKSMKEHGIAIGSLHDAVYGSGLNQRELLVPLEKLGEKMSVPLNGTGVELRSDWGALGARGNFGGASIIVEDRVYTRLIVFNPFAVNALQVPVCMEVWYDGKPGVPHFGRDPTKAFPGGFVWVVPQVQLKAVSRFHE
ncbi:MAG TPA: protein kinase [Archangium sp.]|uniref:serine/threonine protein kinase n=1 Tax=Archangium sp. TaxID=1872627 RepID=UPI002E307681|nr:protein kinase [Archangium sp.]HEX5753006.1 protein kinase [Archangium sp.]